MRLTGTLIVLGCLSLNITPVTADTVRVADVASDFSPTSNPNGVWRYGWSATLGSPFILSTGAAVREGLDTWRGNLAVDGNPGAYHNGTYHVIVLGGSARYEPGQFGLHPGPAGEYGVVRYVAPIAGGFSIQSVFAGQDLARTTTDVHVLLNGDSVFDDFVERGPGAGGVSFFRRLRLRPGDTIDFAVGFGRNTSYFNDSTSLAATVSPIPEPSTLLLLSVAPLMLYRCRQRSWRCL
jgi:hypothetical protein